MLPVQLVQLTAKPQVVDIQSIPGFVYQIEQQSTRDGDQLIILLPVVKALPMRGAVLKASRNGYTSS